MNVLKNLVLIVRLFMNIKKEIRIMSQQMQNLTREVEENTTVVSSAIALIEGLAEEIRANATDQEALQALADRLDASGQSLADAVAANTRAADEDEDEGEDETDPA
jgi:ABC-type molybdenum transport system ATPase subunit/photorepair protein PhrA